MRLLIFLALLISSFPIFVNSYNYLVISPIFGFSNAKIMAKIADTLADSGHNVTLFQPFHMDVKNIDTLVKNKKVEVINYYPSHFEEIKKKAETPTFSFMWDSALVMSPAANAFMLPSMFYEEWHKTDTELLKDKRILEQLREKKFDAMVAEIFDITGLYIGHLLDIPSSVGAITCVRFLATQPLYGQGTQLGYIPATGSQLANKAGFLDRLNDAYSILFDYIFQENLFDLLQQMCQDALGPDVNIPYWKDLIKKTSMYLANANPYLDFAMPNIGSVIQIGGFTTDRKNADIDKKIMKILPDEYEKIMSLSKHTVLVSFGSVVRSYQMPEHFKSSIIETFKKLPDVTFIWKYEQPGDLEFKKRLPSNVHLKKWVPQQAILSDPRLSLFITHGGLGSTMELAYSGIVALMIPLFGDQPHNAMMLARHGGAIAYDKFDLANSQKLTETVEDLLTNPKYKKAASQLQSVLLNQPIDPKDILVKNLEFAVKFPNLKSQVPEINSAGFIGYYYIDVFVFVAILFVVAFYIVTRIVLSLLVKLRNRFFTGGVKSKSE